MVVSRSKEPPALALLFDDRITGMERTREDVSNNKSEGGSRLGLNRFRLNMICRVQGRRLDRVGLPHDAFGQEQTTVDAGFTGHDDREGGARPVVKTQPVDPADLPARPLVAFDDPDELTADLRLLDLGEAQID